MNCQQVRERLPDYLVDELDESLRPELEAHLASCEACRQDAAVWTRLATVADEQPSPALRAGFEAMRETHRREERQRAAAGWLEGWWPRRPAFQLAFSVACLIVGLAVGHVLARPDSAAGQLAQLRQEVRSMRELVALSLLQQQSASERLRGVNWSGRVERPDDEVLSALLRTVKYDPSVDVRLAAVDALKRFSSESMVRQGLIEAVGRQRSPLVQIALIDLLVEIRERQSVEALRQLAQDQNLDAAVRERAESGIERLRKGDAAWKR